MLPDISSGAAPAGLVQPKITQTASIRHRIKRSRELFMSKNRNSPDANTSGGSVKGEGDSNGGKEWQEDVQKTISDRTRAPALVPYNIRQYMSYKIATLQKCKRKRRALKNPSCENQPVLMRPRSTTETRQSKPPGVSEFDPRVSVRAWTWESWHEHPSNCPIRGSS